MSKLNTVEEFEKGFKIKRKDEIFTLTKTEMKDFIKLYKASVARNIYINCLDYCKSDFAHENPDVSKKKIETFANKKQNDAKWLEELYEAFYDDFFEGDSQIDIILEEFEYALA